MKSLSKTNVIDYKLAFCKNLSKKYKVDIKKVLFYYDEFINRNYKMQDIVDFIILYEELQKTHKGY